MAKKFQLELADPESVTVTRKFQPVEEGTEEHALHPSNPDFFPNLLESFTKKITTDSPYNPHNWSIPTLTSLLPSRPEMGFGVPMTDGDADKPFEAHWNPRIVGSGDRARKGDYLGAAKYLLFGDDNPGEDVGAVLGTAANAAIVGGLSQVAKKGFNALPSVKGATAVKDPSLALYRSLAPRINAGEDPLVGIREGLEDIKQAAGNKPVTFKENGLDAIRKAKLINQTLTDQFIKPYEQVMIPGDTIAKEILDTIPDTLKARAAGGSIEAANQLEALHNEAEAMRAPKSVREWIKIKKEGNASLNNFYHSKPDAQNAALTVGGSPAMTEARTSGIRGMLARTLGDDYSELQRRWGNLDNIESAFQNKRSNVLATEMPLNKVEDAFPTLVEAKKALGSRSGGLSWLLKKMTGTPDTISGLFDLAMKEATPAGPLPTPSGPYPNSVPPSRQLGPSSSVPAGSRQGNTAPGVPQTAVLPDGEGVVTPLPASEAERLNTIRQAGQLVDDARSVNPNVVTLQNRMKMLMSGDPDALSYSIDNPLIIEGIPETPGMRMPPAGSSDLLDRLKMKEIPASTTERRLPASKTTKYREPRTLPGTNREGNEAFPLSTRPSIIREPGDTPRAGKPAPTMNRDWRRLISNPSTPADIADKLSKGQPLSVRDLMRIADME